MPNTTSICTAPAGLIAVFVGDTLKSPISYEPVLYVEAREGENPLHYVIADFPSDEPTAAVEELDDFLGFVFGMHIPGSQEMIDEAVRRLQKRAQEASATTHLNESTGVQP